MQELVVVQPRDLPGEDGDRLGMRIPVFVPERHLRARLLAVPRLLHGVQTLVGGVQPARGQLRA